MKLKLHSKIYTYCILIVVSVFLSFPLFWLFLTSFKTEVQLFEFPIKILPHPFTLKNYAEVISDGSMFGYMKNSLIIALATTVCTLIISIPGAYALAKIKFRFSNILLAIILVIRMLPSVTGILAMYQILTKVKLIDTRIGLIIYYLPGSVVFMVILLRNFFVDFPQEMEEAGKIDGLSAIGIIRYILIPITLPAIASASLMCFLTSWNEFIGAATILRSPDLMTMPVGIQAQAQNTFQIYWGSLTSNTVIYVLPVIVFTIFTNKGLISGLTAGAVKE